MEIVVRGRNVEVPDHYRLHTTEKLRRVERYDHKLISIDVELYHERNPRQSHSCQRVEITCTSRGPVVRSEACAPDFYAALDAAVAKLQNRLRRAADRRRVHHGSRTPTSVAAATTAAMTDGGAEGAPQTATALLDRPESAGPAGADTSAGAGDPAAHGPAADGPAADGPVADGPVAAHETSSAGAGASAAVTGSVAPRGVGDDPTAGPDGRTGEPVGRGAADSGLYDDHTPGRIVREKEHPAKPMSIDQALFEMELVGHDFYLFSDADTGRPSVVYRRKGYDYGVIRLTG